MRARARGTAGTATAASGSSRARASRARATSRSPSRCGCIERLIVSMFRSVISRGWPPSLDGGVLGGQAEGVPAHRVQDAIAVAAAEVRRDVADRVDEHVAHVQRPGRVRQLLEHVALAAPPATGRPGRRPRPARPPRRAATSPRSSAGRTARSLPVSGYKKASRSERPVGSCRGPAAVASCAREEAASLAHMLALFPSTASVADGELPARRRGRRELAERFGTPLVVYCEETLRERARTFRRAAPGALVVYGTKAFANVALLRLLAEEGLGADVSTLGELEFARRAGIGGDRIARPRQQQVGRGARSRCRRWRARRARRARRAASAPRRPVSVACSSASRRESTPRRTRRSAPATAARSSASMPTTRSTRCGARGTPGSTFEGLHVHVGSQLADVRALTCRRSSSSPSFAARCRDELGWTPAVVDVGGGFGVRHVLEEEPNRPSRSSCESIVRRSRPRDWADARPAGAAADPRARPLARRRRPAFSLYRVGAVKRAGRPRATSRSTAACPTTRVRSSTARATPPCSRTAPDEARWATSRSPGSTASRATC